MRLTPRLSRHTTPILSPALAPLTEKDKKGFLDTAVPHSTETLGTLNLFLPEHIQPSPTLKTSILAAAERSLRHLGVSWARPPPPDRPGTPFQNHRMTATPLHTRHRLFLILRYASVKDRAAALAFSWVMTVMVLLNVAAVILESVPSLEQAHRQAFVWFDAFSILFFSVEYALRIWTAADNQRSRFSTATGRRLHYMLGFHGLIDLIAILPFFLQSLVPGLDLRVLRILRILRILKLSHYSTALEDLIASIYAERDSFISALYLLALSILIAACLMHYAEHKLQPTQFGTIPDAMWWAIVTITTVGYGDAVPLTAQGKFIAAVTALSGVFTVALLTGIVASAFATRVRRQEIEFTTEVEELVKDGQVNAKEQRTIEHLRREFGITQDHAQAIVRQVIEESSSGQPPRP